MMYDRNTGQGAQATSDAFNNASWYDFFGKNGD
jgi:hypothetical protein